MKAEIEVLRSQNNELNQNIHNLKLKIEKSETDVSKLMESHGAERKQVEVKFAEYETKLKDKVSTWHENNSKRDFFFTNVDL